MTPDHIDTRKKVNTGHEGEDCAGCEGSIPPGETYIELTVPFEGDLYAWRYHLRCHLAASECNGKIMVN